MINIKNMGDWLRETARDVIHMGGILLIAVLFFGGGILAIFAGLFILRELIRFLGS